MSTAIDFFHPDGEKMEVHRDSREIAEVDFKNAITSAEATNATAEVTYWVRNGQSWSEIFEFEDPDPEVMSYQAVRFWLDPMSDITPGKYGVRVMLETVDGKVLISDHPLDVRGAMS